MEKEEVAILGSGPHAVMVADALLSENNYKLRGFFEKDEVFQGLAEKRRWVTKELSFPIYSESNLFTMRRGDNQPLVILGLGQKFISQREKIAEQLNTKKFSFCTIIHQSSTVSASSTLGEGVVVIAGGIINPFAEVGNHVVINTGATVDHDCKIGDNTFIQPGSHLAGAVHVGSNTIIGIGATVKEHVKIGTNSIIGGGAFVNRDVPDNVVYAGVPARKLRNN